MQFTDRQWNQVKAALLFWQAVARESRVHPMTHRAVRDLFGDDKPTPLTDPEIDRLTSTNPTKEEVLGYPINAVFVVPPSKAMQARMRRMLEKRGHQPVGRAGHVWLYDLEHLRDARLRLRKKDAAFRKKYHAPRT